VRPRSGATEVSGPAVELDCATVPVIAVRRNQATIPPLQAAKVRRLSSRDDHVLGWGQGHGMIDPVGRLTARAWRKSEARTG
jgi:hypothetical protein